LLSGTYEPARDSCAVREGGLAVILELAARVVSFLRLMREEINVENKNEFWANASVVVVSPVAFAVGFAKGAYDASTDNGAFRDGFDAAAGPILSGAKKFGHEHGTTITKGVITGAAGTLGARIVRAVFR
jgi:hypothetical protein